MEKMFCLVRKYFVGFNVSKMVEIILKMMLEVTGQARHQTPS